MRRVLIVFLLISTLCGCQKKNTIAPALQLRDSLLQADGCQFDAVITADYGDVTYSFTLKCNADSSGNISFIVIEPDSIAGITGNIDADGGELTFDEEILTFPVLADGYITPVSVPWLLVRSLRGGYIRAGGQDREHYRIQIDDSFEDDPLTADVFLDDQYLPVHCDFLWNNRRILSAKITSFTFV